YNRAIARIRARGEHAFRVLKCQFGYRRTRYRGLAVNQREI
ncbi:transposase, partial [Acidithiobacillus caldus]